MVCRHSPGDPACGASAREAEAQAYRDNDELREANKRLRAELDRRAPSPDAANYVIEDAVEVGPHLVVKARYPSCAACAYEGVKVLVFLDTRPLDAMRWRRLDPHFRPPAKAADPTAAPSPAARFPGSDAGWRDALDYARLKHTSRQDQTRNLERLVDAERKGPRG